MYVPEGAGKPCDPLLSLFGVPSWSQHGAEPLPCQKRSDVEAAIAVAPERKVLLDEA